MVEYMVAGFRLKLLVPKAVVNRNLGEGRAVSVENEIIPLLVHAAGPDYWIAIDCEEDLFCISLQARN